MCWHEIEIEPRDILFFRDARPMDGASVGGGARWPLPVSFHEALFHAFKHRWPQRQEWEFEHKHKTKKDNRAESELSGLRFGGLHTIGPFPYADGGIWLPTPKDIDSSGRQMVLRKPLAKSDLPDFIEYTVGLRDKPDKREAPPWLPASEFVKYLSGGDVDVKKADGQPLYDVESRPGIAIDANTGTVDVGGEDEGGKFYIAEYMRLRPGVTMKGFARCSTRAHATAGVDVMEKFLQERSEFSFVFGGQRGVAINNGRRKERPFWQEFKRGEGTLVKWVLLTPAVFKGGWLPDIVDENGRVCGKRERPRREDYASRAKWREAIAETPDISARLVAGCTGKPQTFSGWNERIGGPRPTMMAVPAGSVYWFKADSREDADALVRSLHGRCRSSFYGEKGFGFGVCGTWEEAEA